MPYQVCLFEDGVQAAPTNWIQGDTCKYPPYMNQIKINKALATLEEPKDNWTTHIIKRKFGPIIENYHDAVAKAKVAEKFSDIEDDEIEKTKRKERAAKHLFDESEDECAGNSRKLVPDLPLPPKQCKASSQRSNQKETLETEDIGDKRQKETLKLRDIETLLRHSPRRSPRKEKVDETENIGDKRQETLKMRDIERLRHSPRRSPRKEKDFKAEVLKKLNTLLYKVRIMESKLDDLTQGVKENATPDNDEMDFPIKTEAQLIDFTEKFDHEKLKICVQQLKVVGGVSLPEITYNILKRLLTNDMANTFSLLGRNKKSFKCHCLYKVVIATVRVHKKDATEKDCDPIIARWLVQAKMRLDRSNKPIEAEKNNNEDDLRDTSMIH